MDHRHIVRGMMDTLRHRGPDSQGLYTDPYLALGVRRLRVIDLIAGDQPIANETCTVWAGLNGEIYNHQDHRAELQSLGHRFRTRCDTEVLVHAWEQYREKCVDHFDGMFACAIWDAADRTLFLARDRMGEKPLYYATLPGAFVFGSELRALLEHPLVSRELSLDGLAAYLAFEYVPDPHSMISGIAKLPPAHTLVVSPGGPPRITQYWDIPSAADHSRTESEWCEALLRQLETSVRRQLVADVPVGFFLSGGVDSSAVVAVASRLLGDRAIKTFAVGFPEPSHDERAFARAVAKHCGTEHHEITFYPDDARVLLERVGDLQDEPLVDGSFLPTYALARFARQTVTVALSGDGGDELFCGYPTFLVERYASWLRLLPEWLVETARWAVNRVPPSPRYGSVEFLLKQLFRALSYPGPLRTQLLIGGLTIQERSNLLAPHVLTRVHDQPRDILASTLGNAAGLDALERAIYQHCKFYLAGQNLPNVDRASMASSLEVRAPFLDRAMVELAGQIPSDLKVHGATTKYILKRALRGLLPPAIIERRKQGFGVPIAAWLRGPLRSVLEERLRPDRLATVGLFNPATVSQLIAEHVSGRCNHRKVLWALLMFEAWRERYLPGASWR